MKNKLYEALIHTAFLGISFCLNLALLYFMFVHWDYEGSKFQKFFMFTLMISAPVVIGWEARQLAECVVKKLKL